MNNTDKINHNAKEINLHTEEKALIRASVLEHIERNPIPSVFISDGGVSNVKRLGIKSPFLIFGFTRKYMVPMTLSLILMLCVGTSVFAQNALPGDLLYPVKINVNENLESFVAVTPKAVAQVSVKQAIRRLTEAEELAKQNKLNASSTDEIKGKFEDKISSVDRQIYNLESRGATSSVAEIKNEFKKQVKKHSDMFLRIAGGKNDQTSQSYSVGSTSDNKKVDDKSKNNSNPDNGKNTESASSTNVVMPTIKSVSDELIDSLKTSSTTPQYKIQGGENDDEDEDEDEDEKD